MYSFFNTFYFMPIAADFNDDETLRSLQENKKLSPVFTPEDELAMVQNKINRGNENNLKALLKDSPYFTSDTAITTIQSDIRKNVASENRTVVQEMNLHQKLLFLSFAKISDAQNEKIDRKLCELEKTNKDLFSTLRGFDSNGHDLVPDGTLTDHNDPGIYMTRERIVSWLSYFQEKVKVDSTKDNFIYVTTSEAVFDHLVSISQDVVNALDIKPIKVHENECENKNEWLKSIEKIIEKAIQMGDIKESWEPELNDGCNMTGQLKLAFLSSGELKKTIQITGKSIPLCLVRLK